MNRKMLKNLAVSGFVLGVATGCSGMGKMADAPSRAAGTPIVAAKSADQARVALEAGKPSKAVSLAEAAVAGSPRDAGYRALLGQAYLGNGRFASATAALTEAMELGATDSNTVLSLALAQIAQNKNQQAVALLTQHRDTVPASDLGLALALAGDAEGSLYVLNEASREKDADARTRQNFALALALSGRWAQARMIASQDLSLAKLEGRMAEWSKLAEQPNAQVRIASLMGTTAREDAGMPVRLALSNFGDTQMAAAGPAVQLASADPAPVADYAPPPPVLADASSAIRSVELPMPERNADGVVPVTELPQPKPAGEVIMADAAPYRAAPHAQDEGRIRPAQKQAIELATVLIPKAMGFDAKKPTGWAVQLGAYDSLGIAREKWGTLKKRNGVLANFPASSHAATVNGRNFYRLTVNGLATRADATSLCNQLKAQGQTCFVRAMGGGEAIQWAAKAGAMRLASR
ncbi:MULTISPECIES: SPOR domain-containing protein [unclassified Sphingopyxis]|jgi:Flp pilus assembly protein TadD|uniref:SPOR domain-containing protein n=1 Tax=unclassified Sphingopyxis TaxID=2614943 RepID=UPI0006C4151C|nr:MULTISPECIES: SPOR domain-containing protein [unclassified Sphingopyxis]USI75489.1 SPOR domain-containing protein [Sphingopyxis sp. USTB-05]GAO78005.1 flp pilus assembly protein TadD, contains TPR repeat [Sphingopyxis sp. C-1]